MLWMVLFFCVLIAFIVFVILNHKKMKHYKTVIQGLEKTTDDINSSLREQKHKNEQQTEQVDTLQIELQKSQSVIQKTEQKRQDCESKITILLQNVEKQKEEFQMNIQELQNKLSQQEISAQEMKHLLKQQISKLEKDNGNKEQKIKDCEKIIENLRQQLTLFENDANANKQDLENAIAQKNKYEESLEAKEQIILQKDQEIRSLIQKRNEEQQQLMQQIQDRESKIQEHQEKLQDEKRQRLENEKSVLEWQTIYENNLKERSQSLNEISRIMQRFTSLPLPDKILEMDLRNTRKFTLEGNLKKHGIFDEQKEKEKDAINQLKKLLLERDEKMGRYLDVLQKLENKIQHKIKRTQGLSPE